MGQAQEDVRLEVEMGGLNSLAPLATVYPDSPDLQNVRFLRSHPNHIAKSDGFSTYNATAMTDVSGNAEIVTGLFPLNKKDTTTRYTIACTKTRIMLVPTSGAWTVLKSGLSAAGVEDWWDGAAFNDELILTNGKDTPYSTGGTTATTDTLNGSAWQTMAVAPQTLNNSSALSRDFGSLQTAAGLSGGSVATRYTLRLDPVGNVWSTKNPCNIGRFAQSAGYAFGHQYIGHGDNGSAREATYEEHTSASDVWRSVTSATTAKYYAASGNINNGVQVAGGLTAAAQTTENEFYDPVTETWTAKTALTAARHGSASSTSAERFFVTGGKTAAGGAGNHSNTNYEYSSFTDAWTTRTALGTATSFAGGVPAGADSSVYVLCGQQGGSDTEVATTTKYARIAGTWSASTNYPIVNSIMATGRDGFWVYGSLGGAAAATNSTYRLNVTPAPPTAFYVDTYKNQVILGRDASFPSRCWYSPIGDAHNWPESNWFDVNRDDGNWITGLFVFRDRLYVSKTDKIYEILGAPFDPLVGIPTVVPVEGVPGTVSNRSIVITDDAVYYLAEDGFRRFDGANSVKIGEKIQPTIDGYVAARLNDTAGVWVRAKDEIWWSMTSTGSTHNKQLVYNTRWQKWSLFDGIRAESIAAIEDANDLDEILFGTSETNSGDGKIYKANSGTTYLNYTTGAATAISSHYQTGFFSPGGPLQDTLEGYLFLWLKRAGNWVLTLNYRKEHATSNANDSAGNALADSINLLSGSYGKATDYFVNSTDQRCRVPLSQNLKSHNLALRFSNTNASETFEIYGGVIIGKASIVQGYP